MSDEIQSLAIENIFTQLKSLSNEIEKKDYLQLPVRNPLFYLFSFPIHAIKNIIKDPAHMSFYMKMSFIFLFNYVSILFEKPKLGLSHRDLFPDNILYSSEDNSLTVLDWESAVISDAMYDLSQLVMIYSKKTNTKKLVKFLKENLDSQYDTERFIALCIFNSLQILGNHSKDNPIFQNTITFMETLHDDIIPGITYKKSPFEIINGITLNLIWYFYKITRLPIHSTKKKLMLCYHSVGNDGWRFSARVNTFKKQVEFLKKKYQLKSLPELLHDTSAGVTISFDDGYLNVFENALPILENAGAHATLFALGEPAKVNRSEIDNPLPIMSEEHILSLKNKGWEIGYHTNTHPNLGKLNDTQLQYEIVEGKKNLEKKLGFTLRYFAYPKGIYNNKVIEYTKKAGFEAAFTVDGKELITKNIDPMLFDRIAIEGNLTMKQFEALISPIGLWVAKIFMKVLVFKEKHLTSYK